MSSAFLLGAYPASNARHLSPTKVAETFVSNAHFEALVEPGHSLLVGPRGSGKTTLLKMLVPQALRVWKHPDAQAIRDRITFTGVYVPADIVWQKQVEAMRSATEDLDYCRVLTHSIAMTNLFKRFVSALEDRCSYEAVREIPSQEGYALWEAARTLLQLGEVPPTATGITYGLSDRFAALANILRESSDTHKLAPLPSYCHIEPIPTLGAILDRCSEWFGDRNRTWALCFDELEILDDWFRDDIVQQLRSTDQRFVFKLSVAPFRAAQDANSLRATLGHDYSVISLWYPRPSSDRGAREFTRDIAKSVMSSALRHDVEPEDLLGESPFATPERRGTSDVTYEPGSTFWTNLAELSTRDPVLAEHLRGRGIDTENPRLPDVKLRDEFLRKIKPSVLQRLEFQKLTREQVGRRSRKASNLYSGFDAFQIMCEGNPRWLIGVLNDLLRSWRPSEVPAKDGTPISGSATSLRCPRETQAQVLERASRRYVDFIRNWPAVPAQTTSPWPSTLFGLVDGISTSFFERQVLGPFPLDPRGSIKVGEDTPEELLPIIQLAVIQGALVDMDLSPSDLPISPIGRRYRLSFLLSPAYHLLFRVLKHEPLRSVLTRRIETPSDSAAQQTFLDQR